MSPSPQHIAAPVVSRKSATASAKRRATTASYDTGRRIKKPKVSGVNDLGAVDIETEDVGVDGHTEDKRFLPDVIPTHAKGKGRGGEGNKGRQKRKAVVLSDDDDDDGELNEEQPELLDVDDVDFEPEKSSKTKASGAGKRKPTVTKGKDGKGPRGGKGNDFKAVKIKDERKVNTPGPTAASKETKPLHVKPKEHLAKDEDPTSLFSDTLAPVPPGAAEKDSKSPTAAPPAKKRKLPTIKKNKPGTGPSTPASSTPVHAPNKSAGGSDLSELLPGKKPAAIPGNAEVNLMNKNVYAELFKSAGGSTPRSGLSRREKEEERRKELNRMRDDYVAKRREESIHTFNLQSQMDKIAHFEERLKAQRCSAFWPNVLGGRFLDDWKQTKGKEGGRGRDRGVREEGEVP